MNNNYTYLYESYRLNESEEQIYSKEFKKWFGDWEKDRGNSSKIIDKEGVPLIVYHGSKKKFDTFDRKFIGKGTSKTTKGGNHFGNGFYFSPDYFEARQNGRYVYECYLNMKNPALSIYEYEKNPEKYDGIIAMGFGGKEFVVFDSNQIKSSTNNNGNFSKESDNIYE